LCRPAVLCAAYPNLEEDFYATVARLDETPLVVEVEDAPGEPLVVNVDAYQFVYAIIMASERGDASGVPKMISDMARGDAEETIAAVLSFLTPPEIVGLGGYGLASPSSAPRQPTSPPRRRRWPRLERRCRGSPTAC
jgi:hypothetical protein